MIRFLLPAGLPGAPASEAGREDAFRSLNLLAHAQLLELPTGSRCGGHGKCGGDRIVVRAKDSADLSPLSESEKRHLSAKEIADGVRLACQCFPERDGAELEVTLIGAARRYGRDAF